MSGSFGNDDGDENSLDFNGSDDPMSRSLQKAGIDTEAPTDDTRAVYKVMADSKIAVSSVRGKMWKARKTAGQKQMKDLAEAWDEAIRYYNADQSEHRDDVDTGRSGNRYVARRLNDRYSATENIVYSNVNAQLPELYAKNPDINITAGASSDDEAWRASSGLAGAVEKLVNVLFMMKVAPGVSLKNKAKRAVVVALLTNRVWFEAGYTQKDSSSDQALQDLQRLTNAITNATCQEDIREAESGLRALEEKIDFLQPSGPTVQVRLPHQVIIDPDTNDPWLGDCQWVMIEDMMPTEYINAMFGQPQDPTNPENEVTVSVYEPTHILDGGTDDDGDAFSIFDDARDYNAYGFDNKESFNKAKRTKVWRVWDRSTRRLELYTDKNWSWPIWVWDDPYLLDSFFPLSPLWFHENPVSLYAKGEVSYYLDQQDQINEINDEKRRALMWARRNLFYDKNKVDKDEVEKILRGPDASATGIDVPDGMKGTDMIFAITPPALTGFQQLFDKKDLYAAIDRIAATNDMMRGEQFKTNTTNKAIDYYSTMGNMRMDERLDAIEDCIGDLGWKIAQLCLRFMDANTVQQLIGQDVSALGWRPLDNVHDLNKMNFSVVGGTTQKASTSAKKQEAVQVGQILSQFSRAAPASVLKITLRMFSEAFDDVEIREEDWENIAKEASAVVAQGAPQMPGQGGPPQPGAGPGAQPGAPPMPGAQPPPMPPPGAQPGANPVAMVATALQQLPPQMLQALGLMLAKGVPPLAIAQHIQQLTSQQGPVQ
jgi:hypothetical protein